MGDVPYGPHGCTHAWLLHYYAVHLLVHHGPVIHFLGEKHHVSVKAYLFKPLLNHLQGGSLLAYYKNLFTAHQSVGDQVNYDLGFSCARRPPYHKHIQTLRADYYLVLTRVTFENRVHLIVSNTVKITRSVAVRPLRFVIAFCLMDVRIYS